jgi:transposase InsO family protein
MRRRKKQPRTGGSDPIETAFVLRFQQGWTVPRIARYFSVGIKTVYRWLALYADKESRYWKGTRFARTRNVKYGVTIDAIIKELKEEVPERSAVTILELMKERLGDECPSVETIRNSLRNMGYSKGKPRDRKGYVKYEREYPNDLWQVDFKGWDFIEHLGKMFLLALLDDHSRYVLAARWYASDEEAHVIDLLRTAFEVHGLPNEILSDNGSQFRGINLGQDTRYQRLLAMLGVKALHHGPHHPQTKGKLERFFGTVSSKFVPEARHDAATNPRMTLAALNRSFTTWLEKYNTKYKHRSLGGKTPEDVYRNHPGRICRKLLVSIDWDAWIVNPLRRKVSKQNVVNLDGHKFQLSPGHAGLGVDVRRYEDRYEVFSGGVLIDTFSKASLAGNTEGVEERKVSDVGTFKYKRRTYYVGYKLAGKIVRIQEAINGKDLLAYDGDDLIARMSITDGSAY